MNTGLMGESKNRPRRCHRVMNRVSRERKKSVGGRVGIVGWRWWRRVEVVRKKRKDEQKTHVPTARNSTRQRRGRDLEGVAVMVKLEKAGREGRRKGNRRKVGVKKEGSGRGKEGGGIEWRDDEWCGKEYI